MLKYTVDNGQYRVNDAYTMNGGQQTMNGSLEEGGGDVEEFRQSSPEDFHVFFHEVGPVEVGLFDDEDQSEVLFHDSQGEVLVLVFVGQFDVGGRSVVVLVAVLVVEVADVDEDVQHVRTDVVLERVPNLLVVVSNVQLGHQVKQVHLLNLAVVPKVVQQLAHVRSARNQPLKHPAERLKDRRVVDRSEKEFNLLHVHVVLPNPLLELQLVVAPGVGLGQVHVGLVDEYEHAAVVGVLALEVLVYVVEGVSGLGEVRGGRQHENEGGCVFENHLLVGRRLVDVVLGGEVVEFELYFLDFEVVAFHFAGLPQQLGGLGDHFLEDDLGDAASAGLGVPHQQDVHHLSLSNYYISQQKTRTHNQGCSYTKATGGHLQRKEGIIGQGAGCRQGAGRVQSMG